MQSNPLLQKVSDIITKSVPASRIVLLAYCNKEKQAFTIFSEPGFLLQNPAELQLFVLADVPNMDRHAAIDKIEQRCQGFIPVCIILMNKNEFANLLLQGNRFAITVMQSSQLIYDKDSNLGALPVGQDTTNHNPELISWYRRGLAFREMAGTQFKAGEYDTAAFCMHVSAEQFLCMLMQTSIGYRLGTHNIDRQIHLLQFYVPEIRNVFCRESAIDKQRIQSLRINYVRFMHKAENTVDENEVEDYLDELYKLQLMAESLFYAQTAIFQHINKLSQVPHI
ncbi:HEPN domain-containing protein [Pseudoflavitalea rhizosphaerae]|uniref:HEPN domain-containing protein n=1 Tax=Pseudoflavitalea rhizosphaerae TaxID=1884793 RepID=UPI000F8D649A|nr:HEPN domain-containing protein [Pseudoflavitalea rhizosphaerae]